MPRLLESMSTPGDIINLVEMTTSILDDLKREVPVRYEVDKNDDGRTSRKDYS
jgi:hypothetical protein